VRKYVLQLGEQATRGVSMKYPRNYKSDWDEREWHENQSRERRFKRIKENRRRKVQSQKAFH